MRSLPFRLFVLVLSVGVPLAATARGGDIAAFLARHWQRPLAPQGSPPKGFSALEAGLAPRDCGVCHPDQYRGWKESRHAHAMGPGVLGQLLDPTDPGETRACLGCHAPLAEQAQSLRERVEGGSISGLSTGLDAQGVVCAACHVRRYVRYGPPRRDGSAPGPGSRLPHGGWIAAPAFEDSRFCAACHQFGPDGYALNGKPLENTYLEWRASRYAKQGVTCQSCHMPDRQHLWRGIHDPAMAKRAVSVRPGAITAQGGELVSWLSVTNTGAGHFFPTYVTPRVVVSIQQEAADGRMLPGTQKTLAIGREVALDLSRELADTRLAPGKTVRLAYRAARRSRAAWLVYRVRVEPDYFYTGFYRSLLGDHADPGAPLIRRALRQSLRSAYTLFARRKRLGTEP
ncbi:MAG TPA: multiheme c-type cytochrome [Burkholderiales bacterium]|nr:multiheme c-type cytochrome [Burkholderiales bacterium]